ncbi:MAG: hypothetical protein WAO98_03220 [Alphaproteobacteria bacterium]
MPRITKHSFQEAAEILLRRVYGREEFSKARIYGFNQACLADATLEDWKKEIMRHAGKGLDIEFQRLPVSSRKTDNGEPALDVVVIAVCMRTNNVKRDWDFEFALHRVFGRIEDYGYMARLKPGIPVPLIKFEPFGYGHH